MNEFFEKLDALYQSGDLSAVEKYLKEYLDTLEASDQERGLDYASVLNELGGFFRGVSRYAESAEAFSKALEIFRQTGMYESVEYATILLNLAGLQRLTGKAEKAVEQFLEAKDILTACNMQNDYAYASVLNNLSLAYQDLGDYENALDIATKAYEQMQLMADNDHEIATSLNNLTTIHYRMGNFEKAEESINKALNIYNGMNELNVHHAAALSIKAMLLSRAGKTAEALVYFEDSLKKTEHFFGQNIEYAITEQNIALTCSALNDLPAAIKHLKKANMLFEKLLGPEHIRTKESHAMLNSLMEKETTG